MQPQADTYRSLAEVYGHGAYAAYASAIALAGSGGAALVRFAQPAGEFPDPPTPDYTLAINEAGGGRMRLDLGAGRWETAFRPGDLALKPPDATTFAAADTPHRKSFLSLPAGLVAGILAGGGLPGLAGTAPDFRRLHAGPFRCGQLTALLDALWREPSLGTPQGRLFGDGILLAVVATLARHARPDLAPAPRGPALSRGRIDRVRAYVDAHLAEAFGIGDLAAVVGLSPWHFSRAFKAATGRTPRAFVTARRVERAKALLADGDLPLSEVAQACGFADQAHFSTIFRRHAGLPPGAWRRAL